MSIVLQDLMKHYSGHPVVHRLSLEVADGEFFVLLGPSGSGKSTVLRMIAGLVDADSGSVLLHGRDVTRVPPQQRGIGLVFQHYALFRHMTVARNIEFALSIRRVPAARRRRRRDELLNLVGLAGLGNRMPAQLSGGQQQRVALARALAHEPDVLLLDEPFGALDAKIRAELRIAVRGIQRELGVTTIFVTHDQDEAFELADRMGIMNFGKLLEVGRPQELYLRPQTEFVATFLGAANLMVGECTAEGVRLGPLEFPLGTEAAPVTETQRVLVLFRPEDVAVKDSQDALTHPLLGQGTVEERTFAGSSERLRLRMARIAGVRPIHPPAPYGEESFILEAMRSQHQARRYPLRRGDTAWLGVRRIHALTHPGMHLLLLTDGSLESRAALELGARAARLAHARVTVLVHGLEESAARQHLQNAREWIGSGLASLEARISPESLTQAVAAAASPWPFDLVVAGAPPQGRLERAESILQAGAPNLLLVPTAHGTVPSQVLICVSVGEPGKGDIQFSARLLRHLGAGATILTVLPPGPDGPELEQAERFLAAGSRSLSLLGVPSRTLIRTGTALEEILDESTRHELLILGAPLAGSGVAAGSGGRLKLDGLAASLVTGAGQRPVLIVRPQHAAGGR